MKKTFKELKEVDQIVGGMYQTNPELKNNKFGYAYKRFSDKNLWPMVKEYSEAMTKARIEHAMVDEKTGEIITTGQGRGFKYTKKGLLAVMDAEKAIEAEYDAKEIEIEPYFIKDLSDSTYVLSEQQREALTGLILE